MILLCIAKYDLYRLLLHSMGIYRCHQSCFLLAISSFVAMIPMAYLIINKCSHSECDLFTFFIIPHSLFIIALLILNVFVQKLWVNMFNLLGITHVEVSYNWHTSEIGRYEKNVMELYKEGSMMFLSKGSEQT